MSRQLRTDLEHVKSIIQKHIAMHQDLVRKFKTELDRETENPEHVRNEEEMICRNEAIIEALQGILKEIESI
ncbi:MAG: hypothetical protein D6675_11215 [Gemmatimonadetes bacterium]|nr:MAG: hypothetical protein D6675_11215 [Gemmatimonadota bacterium]